MRVRKSAKVNISFVMSVRPQEKLGSHLRIFMKSHILVFFERLSRNSSVVKIEQE
jgi:hypothetical protein